MLELDTDRLRRVLPLLERSTPATVTSPVQFDDEVLQQNLDVGALIRRGGTFIGSEGLFGFRLEVDTGGIGAATFTVDVDPYTPQSSPTHIRNDLPAVIPDGYDAWLMWCEINRVSGAVDPEAMVLGYRAFNLGISNTTPTPGQAFQVSLDQWLGSDGFSLGALGDVYPDVQGRVSVPLGIRIARGDTFRWSVRDAGIGAFEVRMDGIIGYFPEALGQDILSP